MGVLGLAFEQKPTQCYATQSVFIVFWVEYQPHILLHVMVFGAKVVDSLGLVKAIAEPGTQRPQTRMANLSWIDSFSTMCAQFRKLCTLHAYAIRMNSECTRKSGPIETGWISWSRTFPSNFDYIKCIHLNCSWILLSSWAQQNWWGVFFLLRFAAATVMCIVCAPPWNRLKLPSAYTHGAPQCHNRHIRHCQPVEFVERDNEKNASSITFYFVFRCFFFCISLLCLFIFVRQNGVVCWSLHLFVSSCPLCNTISTSSLLCTSYRYNIHTDWYHFTRILCEKHPSPFLHSFLARCFASLNCDGRTASSVSHGWWQTCRKELPERFNSSDFGVALLRHACGMRLLRCIQQVRITRICT